MSLHIACPSCGQSAVVPDAAINKRARCTMCNATYRVRDAVVGGPPSTRSQHVDHTTTGTPLCTKLLIGFGFGLPVTLFLVFAFYWFGIRDTWEVDNRFEIARRCDAVMIAIGQGDDDTAARAYMGLDRLISDHSLIDETLAQHVADVRTAIAPVNQRVEQARRELAEKRQREAEARAKMQAAQDAMASSRPTERYYKDSHGALISESEAEDNIWRLRLRIDAMPDNVEKAYYSGVMKAVEAEWDRIKQQGPVEP